MNFCANDDFDANNYFTNLAGEPRAPFHQNQFGGTLGGPILRNRLFFFGDYQGTRQSSVSGSSIENIPPLAFRTGDFSSSPTVIYDPRTRHIGPAGTVIASPFPGNKIPADLINPTSAAILTLIPDPNFGAPGASNGTISIRLPNSPTLIREMSALTPPSRKRIVFSAAIPSPMVPARRGILSRLHRRRLFRAERFRSDYV